MQRKIIPLTFIALLLICPALSASEDIKKDQKAANLNQKGIDALAKNDYPEAIEYFKQALELLPSHKTIIRNLSTTYNNYGILLNGENKIEDAKEYLYKAIELEKNNKSFKTNLANITANLATKYYNEGDYESAVKELKEALSILPKHTPSLILLGQIYYQMQELKKAQEIWGKAYTYDPNNAELKEMLLRLKKEEKVETPFKQLDAYFFDIRFDKEAIDSEIYDVRSDLKDAYRDVGKDFNYYPQSKMPVILYTPKDFQEIRKTPDWVAGIYDGKIRLPVRNSSFTTADFKKLLWHEYTHAVVFSLTDGKCPVWFNEGLAKYEELKFEKPDLDALADAMKNNTLIPLSQLNSSFSLDNDPQKLALAYIEAYSFIEFILDRWNFYIIKSILTRVKNGESIESAFYAETNRSMKKLNSDWKEYIQRTYCK